jgi:polar amino acid transport system substrate-binding protein
VTNGYTYTDSFDINPGIQRDVAPGDLQSLKKLAMNRIEYAVIYDKVAQLILTENPDLRNRIKPVGTLTQFGLYVTFSRVHPEAERRCTQLSEGLVKIQSDGTYARIESDWAAKLR